MTEKKSRSGSKNKQADRLAPENDIDHFKDAIYFSRTLFFIDV